MGVTMELCSLYRPFFEWAVLKSGYELSEKQLSFQSLIEIYYSTVFFLCYITQNGKS